MPGILYQIFNDEYEAVPEWDKREVDRKLYAEWERVQAVFGEAFLDHLLELEGEQENRKGFAYYQAGFRLGVRLMLEALTSATE